jgi:5-methylcytosine-specific restriction endonuclease McrA
MESKKTYSEQLNDPRWQKKRLEIMERDNWRCQTCWSDKIQLVVHHKYYTNGKLIYEYPNDALITLCSICHSKIHNKTIDVPIKKNVYVSPIDINEEYKEAKTKKNNYVPLLMREEEHETLKSQSSFSIKSILSNNKDI